MLHITSFLAQVQPRVHPGAEMCRYCWKLNIVTTAYTNHKLNNLIISCTQKS
ncbi:hypothetical protein HanOQP8_Chr15g0587761 [Helianthus annuus]|nr:hypothetical protein HanHA89_Chr15g0630051 [Helianthus annuus]KAJ0653811.1 hypothetical protein HanOQP8_Chr15g0587761 [Helianthus annuus]